MLRISCNIFSNLFKLFITHSQNKGFTLSPLPLLNDVVCGKLYKIRFLSAVDE